MGKKRKKIGLWAGFVALASAVGLVARFHKDLNEIMRPLLPQAVGRASYVQVEREQLLNLVEWKDPCIDRTLGRVFESPMAKNIRDRIAAQLKNGDLLTIENATFMVIKLDGTERVDVLQIDQEGLRNEPLRNLDPPTIVSVAVAWKPRGITEERNPVRNLSATVRGRVRSITVPPFPLAWSRQLPPCGGVLSGGPPEE